MRPIRSLLATAALALPLLANADPTLTVCIDDAAGGFNYASATCVVDGGAGDLVGAAGAITTFSPLGGFTITTAFGEPLFSPGFGMAISTDGSLSGSWIIGMAQTGLNYGIGVPTPTTVTASFTGTATNGGVMSYAVYADDQDRGLSDWGPVGTAVVSGGVGSSSSQVTLSDPFSILSFVTLDASASREGSFFSTDLTVRVPEPASLALVGVALAAAGIGTRRRKTLVRRA